MKKPHILIFNPDQWRGDVLGHLGNPAAVTPVLDECVARDFVSFRGAFCQNPVCTPSRCSFMTGWYPHTRGHRTMHHMLHAERDEPNLLQILKDNGYFVWWGGKNDLVPRENGFEATCDVKYQPPPSKNPVPRDDEAWRGAPDGDNYYSFMRGKLDKGDREFYFDHDWGHILGAIEQINRAPDDQPLCIYLPITYPHPVYAVEEPFSRKSSAKSCRRARQLPIGAPSRAFWKAFPSCKTCASGTKRAGRSFARRITECARASIISSGWFWRPCAKPEFTTTRRSFSFPITAISPVITD